MKSMSPVCSKYPGSMVFSGIYPIDTADYVYLIGEDLLDPYGGAFKVSAGLSTRFPDRVLTTPISEGAMVGLASGMALRGLRPIVEIMFGDFVTIPERRWETRSPESP